MGLLGLKLPHIFSELFITTFFFSNHELSLKYNSRLLLIYRILALEETLERPSAGETKSTLQSSHLAIWKCVWGQGFWVVITAGRNYRI